MGEGEVLSWNSFFVLFTCLVEKQNHNFPSKFWLDFFSWYSIEPETNKKLNFLFHPENYKIKVSRSFPDLVFQLSFLLENFNSFQVWFHLICFHFVFHYPWKRGKIISSVSVKDFNFEPTSRVSSVIISYCVTLFILFHCRTVVIYS